MNQKVSKTLKRFAKNQVEINPKTSLKRGYKNLKKLVKSVNHIKRGQILKNLIAANKQYKAAQ